MATALDQLSGLGSLLGVVNNLAGGRTRTTGTQTTQTNISDEGVNRLVNQMLAGPGGVRDISGAARGAGLYNASTETQMLNDLYARTAGEVEARRSPTTTTTNQVATPEGGLSLGSIALPLGAMVLGGPLLRGGLGALSGILGGAGTSAASTALGTGASLASPFADLLGGASAATGALTASTAASAGSSLASLSDPFADLIGGGLGAIDGAPALATVAEPFADLFGGGLGGFSEVAGGIPFVGSALSGLLGGGPNSAFDMGLSALGGAVAGGPIGMLASPLISSIFGGVGEGLSIICTALRSKGLLDAEQYKAGSAYLKTLSKYTLDGYYYWATGVAAKIIAEDSADGKWTKRCLPWARSRTSLLASKERFRHIKYFRGTLTKFIGQPVCWLIGYTLSLKTLKTKVI